MFREAIATAETVELAFKKACDELGVDTNEAKQEVLEMPVKKTFGLFGGSPAKVRAYLKLSPANIAADYIKKVLKEMELDQVDISINEEEEGATLNLSGDGIGFIIGHRGDTLDALQYLSSLVANQGEEKYYRIALDVGSFREKRKETLENLGIKVAQRSVKTGRNNSLEPMNPYERRIIHTAVQTVEGAKSWSVGEDAARHVIIGPVDGEKPQYNNRGRGDRRDNRDNRRGPRRDDKRNDFRPNKPQYENRVHTKISETAPQPFSPAPLDQEPERKKMEDAPLYGRIR